MAATLTSTQPIYHTRSNSFPSRPHPLSSQVNEHLTKLRSSEATSTSSSISQKLGDLQDLHDCIDKLFQLPLTQQAFNQEQHKKLVDEMLEGSLLQLDICSSAKDLLLQTRESINEFQSVIRRKYRGENGIDSDVRKFIASRKIVKKTIQKVLRSMKGMENKYMINQDDETSAIVSMLREAAAVTIILFQSLLSFIYGSKAKTFLSKLMGSKRVACEEEANTNELAKVDAALKSLHGCKSVEIVKIQNMTTELQNMTTELQNLELCIEDLDGGLECLFRCLIKARVSILNIFKV